MNVELGGPRERTVLAALLLRGNQLASVGYLVASVWDTPPASPESNLRTYVAGLRQRLGALPDGEPRLITRKGGYLLSVRPGELDLTVFEDLVARAESAFDDDEPPAAVEGFQRALRLWRGELIEDQKPGPVLLAEVARMRELRLRAVERCSQAKIVLGQLEDVVDDLRRMVSEYPLREELWAQLIVALSRSGRRAEALECYARVREHLAAELGVEPGARLRDLNVTVLRGQLEQQTPAVNWGAGSAHPPPAQLPHDVTAFVGRDAEVSELDSLLVAGRRATQISAVSGTAGVGKTALAVRWAHRVRAEFPDGQLYVDLHGYGPDDPVSPHDALAGFLTALGAEVPTDRVERAAHFRSLVDGRKVLVVLDNVRTVEQVRPLLPGSASCFVLVTSRDSLAGLVARDGAHRIGLDRLDLAESVGLLRELVGARLAVEPDAARTLAQRCARLPLVLRVAAEFIRARSARPLADLLDELGDEQRVLDVLDADDDPHTAVRAVFSWSYRHLPLDAATMFRLLGVFPGHDAEAHALAALTGTDVRTTRRRLDVLVRAHLVEETANGRYQQHDLLRVYAAELSAGQDEPAVRDAAVDRLLDHYLYTAHQAITLVAPTDKRLLPNVAPVATAPSFAAHEQARRWLDAERRTLLTAAMKVAGRTARFPWLLATIIWRYLDTAGHSLEARELYETALEAARREGDLVGQVHALRVLGVVRGRLGRYGEAAGLFAEALALYRRLAARGPQSRETRTLLPAVLNNLGVVAQVRGDLRAGVRYMEESAAEHERQGNVATRRIALNNLGAFHWLLGDYDRATKRLWEALTISREHNDRMGEGMALLHLAEVAADLGQLQEALDLAGQARALGVEIGNHVITSTALDRLGNTYRMLGDLDRAAHHHRESLRLCRASQHAVLIAESLNSNGETHLAIGDLDAAARSHQEALRVAIDSEQFAQHARALAGLGDVQAARGDHADAREHWQRALEIYERAGAAAAEPVRQRLSKRG